MKISYVFASRSRPEKFFAALDNIYELSYSLNFEIIAALDSDDVTMNNQDVKERLSKYSNVKPFFSTSTGKIHAINREIKNISPDTDIVCCHSDDMVFIKQDFDLDIIAAFADGFNGLAHFPDQVQKHQLCTYPIIHKQYLDFFGYIYNPNYTSLYADKEQQDVAKKIGKYKFINKNILEHRHHLWGYGMPDALAGIDGPDMLEHDKSIYFKYKNMMIITSISPNHANTANQLTAIQSWNNIAECYSLNDAYEIKSMDGIYNNRKIQFVETKKTLIDLVGKPLVNINAMIDFAISHGKDLLLVNSDIMLYGLPDFKDNGITVFSRYDYTDNMANCSMFAAGFDAFFIPNKYLTIFPQAIYAMGTAWWDYWIPSRAILKSIPLYYPIGKFAFHKLHITQYSNAEWEYIGDFFRWEFQLSKNLTIPEIATGTLQKIKSKLIT